MGEKIVTLSGAATDVLYALFFRGALHSGNLPSKSGAAELRELGFAETRYTATEYLKTNHFTFLTAEGQAFAVKHLVNTRFGVGANKKEYYSPITIGIELDISDAQKALDELDERIRNSEAFKVLNGEVFIHNAFIGVDVQAANYSSSMSMSVKSNSELTTHGKLCAIVSRYMVGEATEFTDGLVSEVMGLFDKTETRRLIDSCIEESIRLNCRPGGAIWQAIRSR